MRVDSGPARSRWHRASQASARDSLSPRPLRLAKRLWQLAHHRIHAAQHDQKVWLSSRRSRVATQASRDRSRWARSFVWVLIGGAPTILGAWLGGFIYSRCGLFYVLALGVGAIAQVVVQILSQMAG